MTVHKSKGFTLIELLIVIAILGVLAVVVLVAINPVQQLARARDAGRISTVQQLGHAIESYYASHNGTYPPAATWLNTLVTSGEISQAPAQVTNTLTSYCTGHTNGWCYAADTDSFVVYSALESNTNLTLGGCTAGSAYAAYLSLAGRGCVICGSTTPNANTGGSACVN